MHTNQEAQFLVQPLHGVHRPSTIRVCPFDQFFVRLSRSRGTSVSRSAGVETLGALLAAFSSCPDRSGRPGEGRPSQGAARSTSLASDQASMCVCER